MREAGAGQIMQNETLSREPAKQALHDAMFQMQVNDFVVKQARIVEHDRTNRGGAPPLPRHDAIFRPISERPRLASDGWIDYGRKLTELAERMADFGVAMAFHHHMGTIVETDAEMTRDAHASSIAEEFLISRL